MISEEVITKFFCTQCGFKFTVGDIKTETVKCPNCTSPDLAIIKISKLYHFSCKNKHWWTLNNQKYKMIKRQGHGIHCPFCTSKESVE